MNVWFTIFALSLLFLCHSTSIGVRAVKTNWLYVWSKAKINAQNEALEREKDAIESASLGGYQVGFGIADITGPAAEINMMGYAKIGQDTRGIHTRLYSRAMIVVDSAGSRMCYVSVDLAAASQIVKLLVVDELEKKFGKGVYRHENIILTATHTHSGPGGYFQYLLYIITQQGFIKKGVAAITHGIVKSIRDAHQNLRPSNIYYNEGELLNASINRSPASYKQNPKEERERYKFDTEKSMQIIKVTDAANGKPSGMISWFSVHATSMNNSNKLISSDNKGYAAMLFEKDYNGHLHVGKGPFVAIFGQPAEGDVSPNLKGARCLDTGLPCDMLTSTCNDRNELCVAQGPGKDMFESTMIIGKRQYWKAKELFESFEIENVTGPIKYVYENINMTNREVKLANGSSVRTCSAALGYSFAAGTTDGEGPSYFKQGTIVGEESRFWDLVRNLLKRPSKELISCHTPKAVLLPVGEMKFPYAWTPEIVPTQLIEVGNLVFVSMPGEFTTMAGRRIREDIQKMYEQKKRKAHVILVGLSNTYTNYVTTFEEYQVQRYEGGATLFGQYTLDAYRQQYQKLVKSIFNEEEVPFGPKFPDLLNKEISFKLGVLFDQPISGSAFGAVLTDALPYYYAGHRVKVRFCGANPRNDFRLEGTFLTVERRINGTHWQVYATDSHWETMFMWHRINLLLGTSEVTITWDIPMDVTPGTYRIQYFGNHKTLWQNVIPFVGTSKPFQVHPLSELKNEIHSFISSFRRYHNRRYGFL